jgi:hypothetical protein
VYVVRHNDEGVQFKAMLNSIAMEHVEHQLHRSLDLKEPAAIRRHSRDEISANLLRCESHARSI